MNSFIFEKEMREQIVEVGRRMYVKDFVASNDGNISAIIDENRILITPTGVCKGDLKKEDLLIVDYDGNVIEGNLKPTSEMKMHIAVYKKRKDVKAIVHAHPKAATAFAVAGLQLDKVTLPEVIFSLGKIAFANYGTPSTTQIPEEVDKVIDDADAVLLANHGALTVGKTPLDAYFKMETLNHFAQITINSRLLGGERELNKEEEKELFRVRSEVFGKKGVFCDGCGECEKDPSIPKDTIPHCVLRSQEQQNINKEIVPRIQPEVDTDKEIMDIIREEVTKALLQS